MSHTFANINTNSALLPGSYRRDQYKHKFLETGTTPLRAVFWRCHDYIMPASITWTSQLGLQGPLIIQEPSELTIIPRVHTSPPQYFILIYIKHKVRPAYKQVVDFHCV